MLLEPSSSWFPIQVVPRYETQVSILLGIKGYQCYVPLYAVRKKWSDRIKTQQQPLFPGYIFCRFQDLPAGRLLETLHIIRIISFGGKPSTIKDDEMEAIRKIAELGTNPKPWPSYLQVGQRIKVSTGPLSGISGILVRIKNRHRLVISMEAIMKSISVEVDASDVLCTNSESNFQMASTYPPALGVLGPAEQREETNRELCVLQT